MNVWRKILILFLHGSLLYVVCKGSFRCKCNTDECRMEGETTCIAEHFCYVEYLHDVLTRGCIDSPTPLNCGNRKPTNLPNTPWPVMYCCDDEDFCNSNVLPTLPSDIDEKEVITQKTETEIDEAPSRCSNPDSDPLFRTNADGAKIINPIYIAVPVAGVCVLLALIIFAMYLLRRRNDYYEGYHYHEHVPALHQKQCDPRKAAPTTCSSCGKVNRCTDSERSSSGSETKLFLQV
ncbi:uncharacterized protein LOC124116658 [Haliotis rufescens]|uniref:uncharacterized protein LOC124116658 n=1 Tax=Haliotis rufescens TaxID=6454 RepID=UPI001EAFA79F|nr:uncharacterized protein LOC124116658 [Haliotis rufescens]